MSKNISKLRKIYCELPPYPTMDILESEFRKKYGGITHQVRSSIKYLIKNGKFKPVSVGFTFKEGKITEKIYLGFNC